MINGLSVLPGALLQQIIREAVSNTIDRASPRVIVRTGTPVTVAALLSASVEPPPRLPDPGVAILFELHEKLPSQKEQKISDGQRFGFKVSTILEFILLISKLKMIVLLSKTMS